MKAVRSSAPGGVFFKLNASLFTLVFLLLASMSAPLLPRAQAQAQDAEEAPAEAAVEMTEEEAMAAFMAHVESFGWTREGEGQLGNWATLNIPEGFRYTNDEGARQLMEVYGNPATNAEQGLIAPENLEWSVIFEFAETGYVKDDEKDELNPDKLLKQIQDNQAAGNKQRAKMGLEQLYIDGWAKEPFYNEETNNLEWALLLRSEAGGQTVNYQTKILGRNGVMESILICSPDQLEEILPTYQNLITGFNYNPGKTYGEYKQGDKIAEYGLAALIVGGGVAVAAKMGLFAVIGTFLAKAWKLIVAGAVAVGIGIKKLFGGKKHTYASDNE